MRTLLVGLVSTTALLVGVCPAGAAPDAPTPTPAPIWSGLDERDFSGPIPARAGTLVAATTLDSRVSLRAASRAYRIVYSTTNQFDRRAVSTGAVFVPRGTPPRGGWPVMAWAHGTVGMGDDCAPSAQVRDPGEASYLSHWLGRGFAIVATDYAGMGTPGLLSYLNGVAAAHSVADSVLAAHALSEPLGPRWVAVGHSQGAGAALSTGRYAQQFTAGSGLDYRGVVATGVPANIEALVQFGQGLVDVNVPAPSALSLAAQMTANRQPLELHVYPGADHPGVLTAVLPDADRFLDRIVR